MLDYYRNTYDNLKRSCQHFGQFQYLLQREQGQIQTKVEVAKNGSYVKIGCSSKDINSSLFRSITIYKEGKICEEEWSCCSCISRMREIYKSGFCEEYSIDNTTKFGIRKVVYPDGQQFTNEVYNYDECLHAIGEETYAIQNESIPYLLGDNEIKEYKYVTEDGLFNVIDLRWNYNKEILSSSLSESSDSDSD